MYLYQYSFLYLHVSLSIEYLGSHQWCLMVQDNPSMPLFPPSVDILTMHPNSPAEFCIVSHPSLSPHLCRRVCAYVCPLCVHCVHKFVEVSCQLWVFILKCHPLYLFMYVLGFETVSLLIRLCWCASESQGLFVSGQPAQRLQEYADIHSVLSGSRDQIWTLCCKTTNLPAELPCQLP